LGVADKELTETKALDATRDALSLLEPLSSEQRRRALRWLVGALEVDVSLSPEPEPAGSGTVDKSVNTGDPKAFLLSKKPKNNAQVLAVLGFLLAQEGTETYKAPDLEEMNTRAAGQRIANINRDLDNATRGSGYFAAAAEGRKQLTAFGEQVVKALPDQEAVAELTKDLRRPRRRSAKKRAVKKAKRTSAKTKT
jgi:hypothetical protein